MSVAEMILQAEKMMAEVPQELGEARTQDDYHRVEVKVQMIQALSLCVLARRSA